MKRTSKRIGGSRARSPRPPRRRRAPVDRALVDLAAVAKREGLRWYVFGAQAVAYHGFPRTTADLDVTIELGDRELASILRALTGAGFAPRFADPDFIAATRVLPVVHVASALPIDLVLAGPGLEQHFLDRVVHRKVGRHLIPVIRVEDLIVTKLLAQRPKDLEDVRELLARTATLDHDEIETTLSALEQALGQSELGPLYRRLRGRRTRDQ